MRGLLQIYDGVVRGLAGLAGLILVGILLLVVVDVGLRTFGFQPLRGAISFAEYGLLYFTMFAAPYLLRQRAHVFIEALRGALSGRGKRLLEIATYAICIVAAAVLFSLACVLFFEHLASGENEVRAYAVPRWLIFLPVMVGFLLLATEFLRFLLGPDSMYAADLDQKETF